MNLIKWLSISDRHTKMYLDRSLAPLGLNSSQHMYVLKICETPGVTQDQFIHFFYVHPSNVTRALSALEKAGFLRRECNPEDKRTCRLFPTRRALDARPQILALIGQWQEQVMEPFSPEEREAFLTLLQRVGERSVALTGADYAPAPVSMIGKEENYGEPSSQQSTGV